jgi:hypothetical protein
MEGVWLDEAYKQGRRFFSIREDVCDQADQIFQQRRQ